MVLCEVMRKRNHGDNSVIPIVTVAELGEL